uniref:FYVE-type domain-containing protein n=1 Tax=Strongyloides stercoralis TaxID=6248 RepID=A0A0K0ES01_STRER
MDLDDLLECLEEKTSTIFFNESTNSDSKEISNIEEKDDKSNESTTIILPQQKPKSPLTSLKEMENKSKNCDCDEINLNHDYNFQDDKAIDELSYENNINEKNKSAEKSQNENVIFKVQDNDNIPKKVEVLIEKDLSSIENDERCQSAIQSDLITSSLDNPTPDADNFTKKLDEEIFDVDDKIYEEVSIMMDKILEDAAKIAAETIVKKTNNLLEKKKKNYDNLLLNNIDPKEDEVVEGEVSPLQSSNLPYHSVNGDIYTDIDFLKKKSNKMVVEKCTNFDDNLSNHLSNLNINESSEGLDYVNGNTISTIESTNTEEEEVPKMISFNENLSNVTVNEILEPVSSNNETTIEKCETDNNINSITDDVIYTTIDELENNLILDGNEDNQVNDNTTTNTTLSTFYDNSSNIMEEFMRLSNESQQPVENDSSQYHSSRPTSVVASTHYITSEFNTDILTESERLLGKIEPIWIDDKETDSCMLCSTKFSLILRRHHCRSCGRVLCNSCCNQRKSLPFANDDTKKFRVCESCIKTISRVEEIEKREREQLSNTILQEDAELEAAASLNENVNNSSSDGSSSSYPGPSGIPPKQKKSVLKVKNNERQQVDCGDNEQQPQTSKRSVTFLDGVAPGEGEDNEQPQAYNTLLSQRRALKKIKGKSGPASRKMRETRIEEESISLLTKEYCVIVDDDYILHKKSYDEMEVKLKEYERITIAIRRNIHIIIQYKNLTQFNCNNGISLYTKGFSTLGIDEILLIWEISEEDVKNLKFPYEMLCVIDDIVENCIEKPCNEENDKTEIKLVFKRMKHLYTIKEEIAEVLGFHSLLLHPVRSHDFHNLDLPTTPFLIGTFIYKKEYNWAQTIPNRLLYFLGLNTGCYPTPIINFKNRNFTYTDIFQTTILKVAIDFKNQKYGISQIFGSYVTLSDKKISLWLPKYAKEQVKKLVLDNKSMIIIGLDFNYHADSHLVCQQQEGGYFSTIIFTRPQQSREQTGATFIIFDGALKNSNSKINNSIVEDGVVVRLNMDYMNELASSLENGRSYELSDTNCELSIHWFDIISPIDSLYIGDRYQYGLNYKRLIRSQNMIPSATEWSIRLASIINIDEGKIRSNVSSRIYEIGEMIAARIALTVAPFIQILIFNNISRITFRLNIESENNVKYSTENWPSLEDEYAVWNFTIDDQIVPFLYQLVNHTSNGLHIELNMPIISTRPLPCFDKDDNDILK